MLVRINYEVSLNKINSKEALQKTPIYTQSKGIVL